MFNSETIAKCLASCDERIASVQDKLDSYKVFGRMLDFVNSNMGTKYDDKIQNYENNIKLIKTEKMIYSALANPKSTEAIFTKLIAKYDELMGVSYDLSGNMVITGLNSEVDHLEYCKQSLAQREYIKKLCSYGQHR